MGKIIRLKNSKKALAICLVLVSIIIVMGIIFVPKAYKYYKHKKYMEKYFSVKEESKPLKPLWTKNGGKEFTYKFKAIECDGEYTVTAPKDDGDITCSYQKDGEEYGSFLFFNEGDLEEKNYPDTITGIKSFDIDFDGYTDLIITGTVDSKEKLWLQMGSENNQMIYYDDDKSLDDNSPDFTIYNQFRYPSFAEKRIEIMLGPNFTVDDIEDLFVGDQKNGEFKSYADAYKKVVEYYEYTTPGKFSYKLIYFDEDDIPELLSQCDSHSDGGLVNVNMFTFKDGYLSKILDSLHYGEDANSELRYKDKGNLIINVYGPSAQYPNGHDRGYGIIDGKMSWLYYRIFDEKKDGKAEFVYNEKLTIEQREALNVDLDTAVYETLKGECYSKEIFQQLGVSGFDVE